MVIKKDSDYDYTRITDENIDKYYKEKNKKNNIKWIIIMLILIIIISIFIYFL